METTEFQLDTIYLKQSIYFVLVKTMHDLAACPLALAPLSYAIWPAPPLSSLQEHHSQFLCFSASDLSVSSPDVEFK